METKKVNPSEMKDTLTEVKNKLQGMNSIVNEAENKISNLQYKEMENNQSEQQQEKRIKKKSGQYKEPLGSKSYQAYQHLYHGVPKEEQREQELENLFEKIMMENFSNLKEINIQVQKGQ